MTDTAADLRAELEAVGVDRFTARDYRPGTVVHIVLFRYTAAATEAHRAEVARRFHALAATERRGAPYISSITSGTQQSGEVAPGGFEHGFVVTFSSLGDRNFYVGEPIVTDPEFYDRVHAEFKQFVGPLLAPGGVLVFDFSPQPEG
ncbi:Dabb family protein [Lacisediminihabitans sp.]|uniref:Dabb family protein n=1 Tax=Lacisediminihabitans sp. TaxID=2787631 RepID=UPI00374CE8F1